jgi:hypothetical protein
MLRATKNKIVRLQISFAHAPPRIFDRVVCASPLAVQRAIDEAVIAFNEALTESLARIESVETDDRAAS